MWYYEKKLQFPVQIKHTNPKLAQIIISQYGGPDGELSASLSYLSQRFAMPTDITKAVCNDIGSEELGHLEMVGTLVHQLTNGISCDEVKNNDFSTYFVDNGVGVYPVSAAGNPWKAEYIHSHSDPIAILYNNMSAEQQARKTYDNILRLSDDADVNEVIKFLREREIVHFQRFGEALRTLQDLQDCKSTFAISSPCNCSIKL